MNCAVLKKRYGQVLWAGVVSPACTMNSSLMIAMLTRTLLQSLSIVTEPGLRASKETLLEHREQLIALIKATRVLQGTPDAPMEATKPRLSPRKRLIYEAVWLPTEHPRERHVKSLCRDGKHTPSSQSQGKIESALVQCLTCTSLEYAICCNAGLQLYLSRHYHLCKICTLSFVQNLYQDCCRAEMLQETARLKILMLVSLVAERPHVALVQAGLPDVEEDSRTSKAEDGREPPSGEGATPQPRTTPRAARVAELVNSACRYAEMVKLLCREQGGAVQTDCLHTLLQTLQWQLALALVSCPSPSPSLPPVGEIRRLNWGPRPILS